MGRSPDFTSHDIGSQEEADRIKTLIDNALQSPAERKAYQGLPPAQRPLTPRREAGILAFKAVARAYGRGLAEISHVQGKPRTEVADLYALYRTLLLEARFASFLALPPNTIFGRISMLRYLHVAIHEAPDLLRIPFEDQPAGMLRTRRNRLEDARQAASLSDPWSPDDVRAWVADEPAFVRHLARLAAQAKELKEPKAKASSAGTRPERISMPADPDVVTSVDTDAEPPSSGPQTKGEPVPRSPTPKRGATKSKRATEPDRRRGQAAANTFGTTVPSRIGGRARRPHLKDCG